MEDAIGWGLGVLVALVSLWGGFKAFAKFSPTKKDDEWAAKGDPYVKKGVNVVEELTGKDIDGDGEVGSGSDS